MFVDRLRVSLLLTVGSGSHEIPAGSIDDFSFDAHVWGFDAEIGFFLSSEDEPDPLFADFTSTQLTKASLSMGSHLLDEDDSGEPLVLTGYVLEKRMSEMVSESQVGAPVVGRRYRVRFVDAARAFWTQHKPLELRAAATMADLITSYQTEGVAVNQDFNTLTTTQSVLCVGLGAEQSASFYDFLHWYLERKGGLLELDYGTFQYRVGGAKSPGADAVAVLSDDVAQVTMLLPEPVRASTNVLDGAAEIASKTAVPSLTAVTGVRHDVLLRTPFQSVIDGRVPVERDRLREPQPGIEIELSKCPLALVPPGAMVTLGEGFSEALHAFQKTFRTIRLTCRANAQNPELESDLTEDLAPFELTITVTTELQSDPTVRRPKYLAPQYPVLVEGKVVSVGGGLTDRTWLAIADEATGVVYISVDVPLWNATLVLPFEPNQNPGHMFFPPYKHQRVLLEIGFDEARIRAFLDWAPNAKMPLDSQGNRIAMGKSATNGTTIGHSFTDEKPVLKVERLNGGDHQWIEVSEGVIRLETREDPGAVETVPTYDVTIQVAAAQADVSAGVTDAIGDLTSSFSASASGVSASIDGSIADVSGAVDAAEGTLFGKIDATIAQLGVLVADAASAVARVSAAVGQAKSALLNELES